MILVLLALVAAWPVGPAVLTAAALACAAWVAARVRRGRWLAPGAAIGVGAVAVAAFAAGYLIAGLGGRDGWLALLLGLFGLSALAGRPAWFAALAAAAMFVVAGVSRPGVAYLPALIAAVPVALGGAHAAVRGKVAWRALAGGTALVLAAAAVVFLVHPLPVRLARRLLVPEGPGPGMARVAPQMRDAMALDRYRRDKPPAGAALTVELNEGTAPPVVYLRAQALERFEGGEWRSALPGVERRAGADGWLALGRMEPRGAVRLRGEVRAYEPQPVLYLPVEAVRVRGPVVVEHGPGTISPPRGIGALAWGFESVWVAPGDPALDSVAVAGGEPLYYEFPRELAQIDEAAARIAGGMRTPAAKARAVCAWLRAGEYVDEIDPPPEGVDLWTHVLRTRRGWCAHFAGLAALLLRAEGVPARMAWGFAAVERTPRGIVIARWRDLHAWVEVFVGAFGWVAWEPTPRAFAAPVDPGPTPVQIAREPEGAAAVLAAVAGAAQRYVEQPGRWPAAVLAGVVALVGLRWLWRRGQAPVARWTRRLRAARGPAGFLDEFLRLAQRRGLRISPSETPRRFVGRLPARWPRDAAEALVDLYYAVRFGGRALAEDDRGRIREALARLERST